MTVAFPPKSISSAHASSSAKWGTPNPVPIMHPGVGLGASLLRAYGTFGLQINNPQQFVSQLSVRRARMILPTSARGWSASSSRACATCWAS